jgi:class 3 adenylate cyclase
MFCDLVGSTGLAAKLDPEDWRNLVNPYLDDASTAVTTLGGHVLKKLGDGLMALFGYPLAQENDAERAVRAALAIQRALVEINVKNRGKGAPDLLARIGIESGPVVVEAAGEVFGDAPNVAARVQAAAEPGSVLVTMNAQRQVAGLFVAEEQAARELKGVTEPVQLFLIVRASGGGGRRSGARALTPFVGREEELGLLAHRWERATAGDGQLTLIVGEPGLGKSRLIEEFHARLAETPHTWVEWSSSHLLQNTPLHPIAEWGRLRFGAEVPADQRLADNFPPEELRRRQLAAMTAWVLAGARSQPAVVAFEDLHWADPTSLDLLRVLADRGAQAPLLLLATTRPEFRPPWKPALPPQLNFSVSVGSCWRRAHGQRDLGPARPLQRRDRWSERADGPLFVEEVTRLLLERGEQGNVQAIPPTLQQSLAARLDRLGSAREAAQIGAVLGPFAAKIVRCRLAGSHKVAHRLVGGVRRPHACELAGPMQSRQSDRIAPVRLHPLARPFRDQSWSDHHAVVTESSDLTIKPIASWPGLKADVQPVVSRRQSPDRPLDRQGAVLDIAKKPRSASFRDRNRVLLLGDIERDKDFAILSHGPPSVREAARPARATLVLYCTKGRATGASPRT